MSLTVKHFREFLNNCNDEDIIVNHQNQDIVHFMNISHNRIKISVLPKIGECNQCGSAVHKSDNIEYEAVCADCDADLYAFEYTPLTKLKKDD